MSGVSRYTDIKLQLFINIQWQFKCPQLEINIKYITEMSNICRLFLEFIQITEYNSSS